jgi:hypothetical protein
MGVDPSDHVGNMLSARLEIAKPIFSGRLNQIGARLRVLLADGERLVERLKRPTEVPSR